jgi:hypothetical protein
MITVSLELIATGRNPTTRQPKTLELALGIRQVTYRHRPAYPRVGWIFRRYTFADQHISGSIDQEWIDPDCPQLFSDSVDDKTFSDRAKVQYHTGALQSNSPFVSIQLDMLPTATSSRFLPSALGKLLARPTHACQRSERGIKRTLTQAMPTIALEQHPP